MYVVCGVAVQAASKVMRAAKKTAAAKAKAAKLSPAKTKAAIKAAVKKARDAKENITTGIRC